MAKEPISVELIDLGKIDYATALAMQRERHRDLIEDRAGHALFVCEHPAVITRGRSARNDSLLSSPEQLEQDQIGLYDVERGGDITFHGPGQLVVYPLLRLRDFKTDVGWYMRSLEQVVIASLAEFGVSSERIAGRTGVWIDQSTKISSIGVRISRWCTMHGIAVNVLRSSEVGFSHLIPCGLDGVKVSSLEQQMAAPVTLELYRHAFLRQFEHIFSVLLEPAKG